MRKIGGKSTPFCFGIYWRKVVNIVANIGNGYIERIAFHIKIDGIIKIFCRHGVNGTEI